MKRFLKWTALLGVFAACLAVIVRIVLGRRGGDGGGGWTPPPAPEPPSPSAVAVAEEYVVPVDEPIAPPPESTEGAGEPELVGGFLKTPDPAPGETMPAPTTGMETEAGVMLPDEVLASDRDEGIPAPVEVVAEPMLPLDARAPEEPMLAGGGDEVEAAIDALIPPGATEAPAADMESASSHVAAKAPQPEGVEGNKPEAAQKDDYLTRAFEELAAAPDVTAETMVDATNRPPLELLESEAGAEAAAPAPVPQAPTVPQPAVAAPSVAAEVSAADVALEDSLARALHDVSPKPIQPPPTRNAESYLDEGNVYFNVGQYALAVERYSRAIELDSELIAAYYNRANARTRAGEFEAALSDYDHALDLQPNDADALNNRGMLHLYRTNYAAALRDFNAALAADPTDTTVMVNRGLAHLHGGEPDKALADFREAAALDEGDAAAHYGVAQASAALGNRQDALFAVERTLRIDSGYAREAAGDPRLALLQGDEAFLRLLRDTGSRQG